MSDSIFPTLTVSRPPDPLDDEFGAVMAEAVADSTTLRAAAESGARPSSTVRGRLLARLAASRADARRMVTVRGAHSGTQRLADGVRARPLHVAERERATRPGEPRRARLIEMAPATTWQGPVDIALQRDWLVLAGSVQLGAERLLPRDYHVDPSGSSRQAVRSDEGALLYLREADLCAGPRDAAYTVRDRDTAWPEIIPGVHRRVLWVREGQAAMLYYARAGSRLPQHTHGHDEDCLMVQGELFLDDLLLRAADYQLAPAGTGHKVTETDTGVVVYAHGDLDLRVVA